MLTVLGNILIVAAMVVAVAVGVALFTIARQDGSRTGRVLGVSLVVAAAAAAIYVIGGHHWL